MGPEIVVLGAGTAGLSAALHLAQQGVAVQVIEARSRLGGRILTGTSPGGYPVELGAEFIHGSPPEICQLLKANKIGSREVSGENWMVRDERLTRTDLFSGADQILSKMDNHGPDESFTEFVQHCCPDPADEEGKNQARRYITGFHAANPDLISVHSLIKGMRAEEAIGGEHTFRMAGGYQSLMDLFIREIAELQIPVELETVVRAIRWRKGEVVISAIQGNRSADFVAPRLLVTLPLSSLQKNPNSAPVEFSPPLNEKKHALEKLEMGKVIRVTLTFRERFWQSIHPTGESGTLANLSFLFSESDWFPTWWTRMPEKWPVITGWAPFHCAEHLSRECHEFTVNKAVETLAALLRQSGRELEDLLVSAHTHDWQNDPYAAGAYSYVKVGGDNAQQQLAAPIEDTLFFAGEATDFSGNHGTVHGAIASGRRAATEVLSSLSQVGVQPAQ